ncbi:MAG: helix-turn-helix domain-containing protein, partial [Gemmatimonadota bacterium]
TAAGQSQGKKIVGLSRAAMDRLIDYPWPGNLRELKRVIHTAVAITEGEVVGPEAILIETSVEAVVPERLPTNGSVPRRASLPGAGADLSLREAELRHVRSVLEQSGNNKRQAAKQLGISRTTLDRKLEHH